MQTSQDGIILTRQLPPGKFGGGIGQTGSPICLGMLPPTKASGRKYLTGVAGSLTLRVGRKQDTRLGESGYEFLPTAKTDQAADPLAGRFQTPQYEVTAPIIWRNCVKSVGFTR